MHIVLDVHACVRSAHAEMFRRASSARPLVRRPLRVRGDTPDPEFVAVDYSGSAPRTRNGSVLDKSSAHWSWACSIRVVRSAYAVVVVRCGRPKSRSPASPLCVRGVVPSVDRPRCCCPLVAPRTRRCSEDLGTDGRVVAVRSAQAEHVPDPEFVAVDYSGFAPRTRRCTRPSAGVNEPSRVRSTYVEVLPCLPSTKFHQYGCSAYAGMLRRWLSSPRRPSGPLRVDGDTPRMAAKTCTRPPSRPSTPCKTTSRSSSSKALTSTTSLPQCSSGTVEAQQRRRACVSRMDHRRHARRSEPVRVRWPVSGRACYFFTELAWGRAGRRCHVNNGRRLGTHSGSSTLRRRRRHPQASPHSRGLPP